MRRRKLENDIAKLLKATKEIGAYYGLSVNSTGYGDVLKEIANWYTDVVLYANGFEEGEKILEDTEECQ